MRDWLLGLTFSRYWQARLVVGVVTVIDAGLYLYDLTREWLGRSKWGLYQEASGVHIVPLSDMVDHSVDDTECICGPKVEYLNPETDESYPNGPLVCHHSLDGRERAEVSAVSIEED